MRIEIDLVHDRVVVPALRELAELVLHVVAKIIETEFVVGAVGDVGGVGLLALPVVEAVHDGTDGEPQEAVDPPIHSASRAAR